MRIAGRDEYARDARTEQQIRTRNAASTTLRARLKSHVSISATRRVASLRQRDLFRVRTPANTGDTFADNRSTTHDHTANTGVIASLANMRRCYLQRAVHESSIAHAGSAGSFTARSASR